MTGAASNAVVEVAAFTGPGVAAVGRLRGVEPRVVGGEHDVVRLCRVADAHGLGGGAGGLEAVGDGQRHVPAAVRDPVVLEHVPASGRPAVSEAGRVLMGQDGEHAGQREGRARCRRR